MNPTRRSWVNQPGGVDPTLGAIIWYLWQVHIDEVGGLLEVGALLRVLDDVTLDDAAVDLELDARRRARSQLVLLHVPHSPAEDLDARANHHRSNAWVRKNIHFKR